MPTSSRSRPAARFSTASTNSTLNFTVRAYLASIEPRIDVTHELRHRIHQRFAAKGSEIALQQVDLHLRSIAPGIQLGRGRASKPEKN